MSVSTLYAGLSGSHHLVSQPYVGNGGSWLPCRFVYVGQAGAWQQIFKQEDPLSVNAADVSHESDVFGAQSQHVSGSTTATAAGGSASYSYAWSYVSGDSFITIDNAALQSPTFTSELLSVGGAGDSDTASAVWRCTVTDSESHTAHCDINVTLTLFCVND